MIHKADPQSRVTETVNSIYVCGVCTSVRPSVPTISQNKSENSDNYRRDCGYGRVDYCLYNVHMSCYFSFYVCRHEKSSVDYLYNTTEEHGRAGYFKHMYFINYERYGQKNPLYISMVRHPVERIQSWYYYTRATSYLTKISADYPVWKLKSKALAEILWSSRVQGFFNAFTGFLKVLGFNQNYSIVKKFLFKP